MMIFVGEGIGTDGVTVSVLDGERREVEWAVPIWKAYEQHGMPANGEDWPELWDVAGDPRDRSENCDEGRGCTYLPCEREREQDARDHAWMGSVVRHSPEELDAAYEPGDPKRLAV